MDIATYFSSSVLITFYLMIQTKSDMETKTVYTSLNNFMILAMLLSYIARCFLLGSAIEWKCLVGIVIFFLLHSLILRKMIGIGDAKALVAIYLQSSLFYSNSPQLNLFYPVFVYFLANVFFTIAVIANGIKEKKKMKDILFGKEKRAFFPYLLPSYAITVVFWMAGFAPI